MPVPRITLVDAGKVSEWKTMPLAQGFSLKRLSPGKVSRQKPPARPAPIPSHPSRSRAPVPRPWTTRKAEGQAVLCIQERLPNAGGRPAPVLCRGEACREEERPLGGLLILRSPPASRGGLDCARLPGQHQGQTLARVPTDHWLPVRTYPPHLAEC